MKFHILNHHVWPDGSANCIYSEQLAIQLTKLGQKVVLVGGSGTYRQARRPKPDVPLHRIPTLNLSRNKKITLLKEYISVFFAFISYLKTSLKPGDVVLITTDPFLSIFLLFWIPKGVTRLIWLMDYFPDGILSLHPIFRLIYPLLNWIWRHILNRYDAVIKISDNLNYNSSNAKTMRLWPTHSSLKPTNNPPKKWVLYSGNIGYVTDLSATLKVAKNLYDRGYEIHFYADGPKSTQLPKWVHIHPITADKSSYLKALRTHEIHLIAGTHSSDGGSFPSKLWNSLASGRKVIPCGFKGKMLQEFNQAIKSKYRHHLMDLSKYLITKASEN